MSYMIPVGSILVCVLEVFLILFVITVANIKFSNLTDMHFRFGVFLQTMYA